MAKTYEASKKREQQATSAWQFLDLQNKKQTGDINKRIIHLDKKDECGVYNFVSCRSKEGVSTILANLLNYIKQKNTDKKVLVIDANFQNPTLHTILNLNSKEGLSDVLNGTTKFSDAVQNLEVDHMYALPCGNQFNRIAGAVDEEKFVSILTEGKAVYDFIFIDSPPLLVSSDAISIAAAADQTFMVVRSLKVQKEVLRKTKILLDDNECNVGGVILNRVQQVIPGWMYKII